MISLVIAAIVYVVVFPIGFRLLGVIDKNMKQKKLLKLNGGRPPRGPMKNAPEPVYPKWKERINFTLKDKRDFALPSKKGSEPKTLNITRRLGFWLLQLAGLLVALAAGFTNTWWLLAVAAMAFYGAMIYAIKSSAPIIEQRQKLMSKIFNIARSKMGISSEYESNPGQVIRVIEWADLVKPRKIEIDVPDTFSAEMEEGFMRQFNQVFGAESAWVPSDDPETGAPGWDYENGIVTLHSVPPLPTKAPWSEHYVLSEGVAWSFFPMALGVEGGLELPNPKTGLVENVIGFDVAGEAPAVASKAGLKISPKIAVSPQGLVAGSTGGGKALASDTLVDVINNDEKDPSS